MYNMLLSNYRVSKRLQTSYPELFLGEATSNKQSRFFFHFYGNFFLSFSKFPLILKIRSKKVNLFKNDVHSIPKYITSTIHLHLPYLLRKTK